VGNSELVVLTSKNSITPSRAFLTNGVVVLIAMPGMAGIAHDATGFGAFTTSTRHIRQFPAIDSR
jgi:hypothetical protein